MAQPDDMSEACSFANQLRLLVKKSSQPERVVDLSVPFAVIGRASGCDLVLDDDSVSRRHAYLQVINGRVWCFDMLSRTGISRDSSHETASWLDHGNEIKIGPYELRNLSPATGAPGITNPLLALTAEADQLPTITVEFPNATSSVGPSQALYWQLDRVVTFIGKASACKIRFHSSTVSSIHCSLLRTARGVWAIDLLGQDGILINGQAVRAALLRDRDSLQVGRFKMIVHLESCRASKTPRLLTAAPLNVQPSCDVAIGVLNESQANEVPAALIPDMAALGPSAIARTIKANLPATIQAPAPLTAGTGGTDASQTLLLTFVQQFSTMQQQMFDQFQQTTAMMLQMFGTIQRDQFALIRQELNELRELNQEISTVQAEMLKFQAAKRDEAGPVKLGATVSVAIANSSTAKSTQASLPSHGNPTAAKGREKRPAKEAIDQKGRGTPESIRDSQNLNHELANSNPTTKATGDNGKSTTPKHVEPSGDEVYAWLGGRFADLQQERQNRWQKLVSKLLGK